MVNWASEDFEKIKKTEVLKQGNTENGVTQNSRSVNISIAQIFAKVNHSDKYFLKYIHSIEPYYEEK